jgi:hypothetical protein
MTHIKGLGEEQGYEVQRFEDEPSATLSKSKNMGQSNVVGYTDLRRAW